MITALEDRLSPRAKIAGAFAIGFGFFAGAGVTGLSMLIGVLGIWAWIHGFGAKDRPLLAGLKRALTKRWLVWLSFVGFVIWAMVTSFWSPAQELAGESVRRLSAMLLLAPLAVWACARDDEADQALIRRAVVGGLFLALFVLVFETITDGAMNKIASPEKEPLALDGDLGRAATATLSLFWIGFACLKRDLFGPRWLVLYVAASVLIAFQFGTDLNAIGMALGTAAALLALSYPCLAIGVLTGVCALVLASAPLLYPLITKLAVSLVPGGQLPMSYGRRAQMWQLASDLISQKPLTGWGIGAGSTFDKPIQFAGFTWPELQLHPHAAPLHIWLETGAIGAALGCCAIVTAGAVAASVFGRHKVAASALIGGLSFVALQWGLSHAAWREWMWTSFAAVIAFSFAVRDFRPREPFLEEDDF